MLRKATKNHDELFRELHSIGINPSGGFISIAERLLYIKRTVNLVLTPDCLNVILVFIKLYGFVGFVIPFLGWCCLKCWIFTVKLTYYKLRRKKLYEKIDKSN